MEVGDEEAGFAAGDEDWVDRGVGFGEVSELVEEGGSNAADTCKKRRWLV